MIQVLDFENWHPLNNSLLIFVCVFSTIDLLSILVILDHISF